MILKDLNSHTLEALRFTRALFGLTCSPFLPGGVVQRLLESCGEKYPEIVREIEKSLYVDELIIGGPTRAKAETIKSASMEIFAKGTFELHKWYSSVKELETACSLPVSEDETYSKEQLRSLREEVASMLELQWNKESDTISINFPSESMSQQSEGFPVKWPRYMIQWGLCHQSH